MSVTLLYMAIDDKSFFEQLRAAIVNNRADIYRVQRLVGLMCE